MTMSAIGETALSAFIELSIDKLVNSEQIGEQLKEWQSMLLDIKAVLNDAEEKQSKDEAAKKWLADLHDLVYDVDDFVDKFAYEALRLKLQRFQADFVSNNKIMMSEVEDITARLNDLASEKGRLGLREISGVAPATQSKGMKARLQPTCLLDEAEVYGREEEKREMLELLKSGDVNGVSVISIVGMAGIGKTTLAQLVYNDPDIRNSFDCHAWVCVSDDFDAVEITKTILRSISSDTSCDESIDLILLQAKLKEKLCGKRFLLVLDDVWNESLNDWTVLRSPFGAGTKIIVTTRSHYVSSNVVTLKSFHLDKLSHDDCLSIFTQHALGARNFGIHMEFEDVGEEIVRKCDGLPLAAKAIGGLLRAITDHDVWRKISKCEIWELSEDCGIIPSLLLSYHHLPPQLKRCFAYCSILPKQYEFKEEEIVLLWRAEGFLPRKDLGRQYFRDLVSRSFFQVSSKDQSRFVMHDLINDLAQFVAGEICSKQEGDKQRKLSNRTRHSSYVGGCFDGVKVFEAFDQAEHLRTFLPFRLSGEGRCYLTNYVLVELLPRLRYLRVLSLKKYQITELPEYLFENLKQLRHLDLSDTKLKCLPDSLCTLYHLETLLLRECEELEKLPSGIWKLVSLVYLDMSGAYSLTRMPFGIGSLTNLQWLPNYVIGEGDGGHILEVKNMSKLEGQLRLCGLRNVVKGEDAREAKLSDKLGIDSLELNWSLHFENSDMCNGVEEQVLDCLRPHYNIERVTIMNYGGPKLSTWVVDSSMKRLSSLSLINCRHCKSLPPLGMLPSLEHLTIRGFDQVAKVGRELFGENQSNPFPSLKSLCFWRMPNWEEWDSYEVDEQVSRFPCLQKLTIKDCPQLFGMLPNRLPSLQRLVIRRCERLVVSISSLPLLSGLQIVLCENLVFTNDADTPSIEEAGLSYLSKFSIPSERILSMLAKLKFLEIHACKELVSSSEDEFGFIRHLISLRGIAIMDCPQLKKISSIVTPTITEMHIDNCASLVCFAENNLPPALRRLAILNCENLQILLDQREDRDVNTTCFLEHLEIQNCPSLTCLSSIPIRLQSLEIRHCSKLTCLFQDAVLPDMLNKLCISSCSELECIAEGFEESSRLESIDISWCDTIKSLPRGLDKLSHLQQIEIYKCPNLVSFEECELPRSTKLQVFSIEGCENFGPLFKRIDNNFTSLRELSVQDCSADYIFFPKEGFPTNLKSLAISNAPKICKSILARGLHTFTSLETLSINGEGCSDVFSFPDEEKGMTLPPSLTALTIGGFKNLEYLWSEGFRNLTSLKELRVSDCSRLTSLPEKDMLLSLEQLFIHNCPLLKEECQRGRGRLWSTIAHIPFMQIEYEEIIAGQIG